MAPEFLIPDEVEAITRIADPTRRRMEARGLFPRRIRIAPRRIGWRRTDVESWVADPEGWPRRAEKPPPALDNPKTLPSNADQSPYQRWRAEREGQGQANG